MRRQYATHPTPAVKMAIVATMGVNRIPNGVKFRRRPRRGTIAMLRPKERAIRSIQSMSSFAGS